LDKVTTSVYTEEYPAAEEAIHLEGRTLRIGLSEYTEPPLKVSLYNVLGKEVFALSIDSRLNDNVARIPVGELPLGMYVVVVTEKNSWITTGKVFVTE